MDKKVIEKETVDKDGAIAPSDAVSIGQLAKEFGISTRAIRFYEEKGLLNPNRTRTGRVYNRKDRARLILILRGKRLGFSLDQITDYIELYRTDATQVRQIRHLLSLIKEMKDKLEQQRLDLTLSLEELDKISADCRSALKRKGAKP